NQKNYKKDNFYIISIEIVFFHLSRYFMSRTLSLLFRMVNSCLLTYFPFGYVYLFYLYDHYP
ncbi:hypothetical protein, partial [Staphylococcus hominis]